jgi:hypothetical protein
MFPVNITVFSDGTPRSLADIASVWEEFTASIFRQEE